MIAENSDSRDLRFNEWADDRDGLVDVGSVLGRIHHKVTGDQYGIGALLNELRHGAARHALAFQATFLHEYRRSHRDVFPAS